MAVDWRSTLASLLPQFQALAARSPGLNHLFVEVADAERDKMQGPPWFAPFSQDKKIRVVDGKPQYGRWDCCFSRGLPGISPGYREPMPQETFHENDSGGIIRDGSGVVRAVAVRMKLRQGYYCGKPSEEVSSFESLANAAAAAMAGQASIQNHAFASDLIDIFRQPRGGIRYIFGDVPKAPNQFIARGWDAGVLQFEKGVLVDVPIAESSPDASHWLLLLHRLGWRGVDGTGLRAMRMAWEGSTEASLEFLSQDLCAQPGGFAERFSRISKESFYSVLGTKDAPLDVNLASVFAIQMLTADLASIATSHRSEQTPLTDYSHESWKLLKLPKLRTVRHEEATRLCRPMVGILVATEVEKQAALKKMRPPKNKRAVLQVYSGKNTCFVGRIGTTDVVLCLTAMGSVGRDASTIVATEVIEQWQLSAVIAIGIAFGKDASRQEIGNVLISDRIISYEPERIGEATTEDRGSQPMAGPVLLNRFRNVIGWSFTSPSGQRCGFQVGPILSGEKLVDNTTFKQKLFERFPTAIGGEMEGIGIAAAAARHRCEWIVAKAICDWGDGTKTKHHQEFAAAASVALVEHVLNQPGALDALDH